MTEAIAAFHAVSATPAFKELERARHYAKHNEASALGHAHDLGRAEGKAEGKAEGRLEVARAALRKGIPVEVVAEFTGLSVAEIETLAGE